MKKELSKCCSVPTTTGGKGDFHDQDEVCTMYNSCEACKRPCDVKPQKPSERIHELVQQRQAALLLMKIDETEERNISGWIASILDYLDEQAELNNKKL